MKKVILQEKSFFFNWICPRSHLFQCEPRISTQKAFGARLH